MSHDPGECAECDEIMPFVIKVADVITAADLSPSHLAYALAVLAGALTHAAARAQNEKSLTELGHAFITMYQDQLERTVVLPALGALKN